MSISVVKSDQCIVKKIIKSLPKRMKIASDCLEIQNCNPNCTPTAVGGKLCQRHNRLDHFSLILYNLDGKQNMVKTDEDIKKN